MSIQLHRVTVTCARLLRGSDDNLRAADLDKISTLCLNDLKIMLLSRWKVKRAASNTNCLNYLPTLPWIYVDFYNFLILSISDFQRGQSLSSPLHLRFCLTYRYVHRIILACTPPLTVPLCSQVTILSLSHQLVVPQLLPPAAQLQR